MEFVFTHVVEYKTKEKVPVEEVAHSLLATARIIKEVPDFLNCFYEHQIIEKIDVSLEQASEGSLREVFWGIVFVSFQAGLTEEVPDLIEKLAGYDVPDSADTIVTAAAVILTYYVAEFVYKRMFDRSSTSIKRQLDGLIADLSSKLKIPEDRIRRALSDKYDQNRLRSLANSVVSFFKPSRGKENYPITVGRHVISKDTVDEVPRALDERKLAKKTSIHWPNASLDIIAQHFYDGTRWAAVISEISPRVIPLKVFPPVFPEEVYTRRFVRGEVMAIMDVQVDGSLMPSEYHLIRMDQ